MNQIVVHPDELIRIAGIIETNIASYETEYTKLMHIVEKMQDSWKGADNLAFLSQIEAYQGDFRQLQSVCEQYALFLRNTAVSYEAIQNELIRQASMLG